MVNIKTYSFYIGLIFFLFTFFGCGAGGSTSADSNAGAGSIGFGLAWESPDGSSMSKSTAFRAASIDVCTDYGITTINAYVINSANSTVTSGSWACSEHAGSHTAVPAGSNYTLRVEAVVSGAVKWRGEVTGISIITGQTTNLGQITMSYIGNDTTPPTVSSTGPASDATSISVNSTVTVTFNEKIAPSSLDTNTFTLSNGPNQINGTVSYDQNSMTATFAPISPLSYATTYTATLTTGVKDMAGNNLQSAYTWTFTTGSTPDTTPPTVLSTSPANTTTAVAVNAAITATFSETMDASTVSAATFTLNNGVTGTVTYSGTTATFTLSSNLAYSTTHTATITTGAKDSAGNAMAVAYTWTFTTGTASTGILNDTGITASQCYEAGSDVLVDCGSAGGIALNNAQDGMAGRDADVANNSNTDGKLGFSFASVTGGCVQDNVTGLMWEVKTTDGGLRDWTKTYTNYSSTYDPNGLYGTATDASGFVTAVNATNLCGYSDWRLPTADELQSIVDYSVTLPGPAVDATWFPNTQGNTFWSASPFVGATNSALWVGFANGSVGGFTRNLALYVRLVRAGQPQTAPRYSMSADGQEVTDNQTNLIWRRCAEGMNWDGSTCTGTAITYTHEAALQRAAAQASSSGIAWRLPNIKELSSIADKSLFNNPAIDPTAFPATPASGFWSASTYVASPDNSWVVSFNSAYGGNGFRIDARYVRLVRSITTAPSSAPPGVIASGGDGQVTISWNAVSGATSYNIYWSTTSGVTKTSGTKISNTTSPYTHTGRTNGTTYYYVVTAVNSYGESTDSSQVSASPSNTPIAAGRMPDTNQTTSYTSTFGEDHDYTINPPSYTDNGDGTVTDNVTGLVWQKQDDATTRTWADAGAYCDASTLGGYSDWRLPSQIELISIIDNGVYSPSINTTFFPGTSSSNYWSSTTYGVSTTSHAWHVHFNYGESYYYNKTDSGYVRCVRGGQATPSLTDNGNGTVTDSGTLLTWQQGENSAMTWEAALTYCEGLSLAAQTDWRLPNHKELMSLVDYTRYNPSINTTLFPSAISSYYWSSTTYAYSTSNAWNVYFNIGYSNFYDKASSNYVRCVRGGQ